jgi:hypothetical protein
MSTMILPGTYIDVLSEGLIAPGQITVGNLGVVGTASKGSIGKPTLISSYNDALAIFGPYDSYMDPTDPTKRRDPALTLVRALELAFGSGATTVYAVRVGDANAKSATATLSSAGGACVTLTADSEGTWGNSITAGVAAPLASDNLINTETLTLSAGDAVAKKTGLAQNSVASSRNRVSIRKLDGSTVAMAIVSAAPAAGQAQFSANSLLFGDTLDADTVVTATYKVDPAAVVKVTVTLDTLTETYLATDGNGLAKAIMDAQTGSSIVSAAAAANSGQLPTAPQNVAFKSGANGETNPDYNDPVTGLNTLLDVDAHIIVAAGQTHIQVGAALDAHCQKASTDTYKRDRIAVVGSDFAKKPLTPPLSAAEAAAYVDTLVGNTLASDRVILIAPGMKASSAAKEDAALNPILLPGAYTAAVIAGMLAGMDPHISLTNKPVVGIPALEIIFNNAQLTELVQNRVTALEVNQGIRVLRGQTTDIGAFREITTRRIVDYAKYGVRSAAQPYIGLLNNDRVRGALRATLNSFLQGMLDNEMLVDYTIEVTATRPQQIAGIVQVTLSLQPVFSINFIHVTMILS